MLMILDSYCRSRPLDRSELLDFLMLKDTETIKEKEKEKENKIRKMVQMRDANEQ